MDNVSPELLVGILRACAAQDGEPFYPAPHAQSAGLDRHVLDQALDRLRLAGFLRLTDWVAGKGQGYVLTPDGKQAVAHPQILTLLQMAKEIEHGGQRESVEIRDDPTRARGGSTEWERGEAVRASLFNVATPVVTMTLIGLNVLVFLLGAALANQRGIPLSDYLAFRSGNQLLLQLQRDMGALFMTAALGQDQWWRLVTYCFLHSGLLHIFLNMYFLYSLGPQLESMWGRAGYLYLYLISGIAGGVAVVASQSAAVADPDPVTVGASGSLCGLLTSMVVWIWLNRAYLGPQGRDWLRNILVNIVIIAIISMVPGVSAAGHFGGGLAGLAIALPMIYWRFGTPGQRTLGMVGALLVGAIVIGAYIGLSEVRGGPFRVVAFSRSTIKAHDAIVPAIDEAKALLRKGVLPADAESRREMQRTFQTASQQVQSVLRRAPAETDPPNRARKDRLETEKEFLTLSAKVLDGFADVLDQPADWPRQRPFLQAQLLVEWPAASAQIRR